MLQPLKLYKTKNEIFVDLDLWKDEMDALINLFEDYWEIQYNQEEKHVYTVKPSKDAITNRDEVHLYWLNFIVWTYTLKR